MSRFAFVFDSREQFNRKMKQCVTLEKFAQKQINLHHLLSYVCVQDGERRSPERILYVAFVSDTIDRDSSRIISRII